MKVNLRLKKDYLNYIFLILIILLSFVSDKVFLKDNLSLPAWDQGYHLTNLFKTYNIFGEFNLFNTNWWQDLWKITDTYRGPFTYILSALFLKIFGANYQNSYLSNHIFSIITIISIYNLGIILKNKSTGLWASFLFTVNPFIFEQRIDYLIDLSQLSIITFNFYLLTRYFLINKNRLLLSILSGFSIGLLFLTKPTDKASFSIKNSEKFNENKDLISTIDILSLFSDLINFKFKAIIQKIFINI